MNTAELTNAQEIFVREFLTNGHKGTDAALIAFPNCSVASASRYASELMAEGHKVRRVIDREMKKLFSTYEITQERILQEMACLAFYDPSVFYDDNGNVKPLHEIPEKARRAIAGLDVEELFEWDTDDSGRRVARVRSGYLKKIKVTSKEKALEMLGRYQKMFVDKTEVDFTGKVENRQVHKVDLDERIEQIISDKVDARVKEAVDAMLQ